MPAKTNQRRAFSVASLAAAGVLLFSGCSINVRKNDAGEDKKVDIETPIGGIHVDNTGESNDTGLAVYPGAKVSQEKTDNDNANVNLSAFGYGLRVEAVGYESDDSPAKVTDFYRGVLKKFGEVLECHTSSNPHASYSHHDNGSDVLTCENDSGSNLELKAGTKQNQHIVSIETRGKGSKFSLVHVLMQGKDTI